MFRIGFKKLHPEAILPRRWSDEAVGWDVHAHLISESGRPNTALIPVRNTRPIPTGLLIEPPPGFMVLVLSRSGLALKSIFVGNQPGLIDPDYRGELKVLLYNGGLEGYHIRHQERIAQIALFPVTPTIVVELQQLTPTRRGDAGFGSTGD
jgi:dUTP pyrophosphatase